MIKKMAILQNEVNNRKMVLLVEPLFGMLPEQLNDSMIEGDAVLVRDVVDGGFSVVDAQARDLEGLGRNSDCWALINVENPKTLLLSMTDEVDDIVLGEITQLPSKLDPELIVYTTPGGRWVCENESGITLLKTGDKIEVRGSAWYFVECPSQLESAKVSELRGLGGNVLAVFDVSKDEAYVSLKLIADKTTYNLSHRKHHGLMLLLARKRLDDVAKGVLSEEQGWIRKDALGGALGLKETHINIQLYRFRQQLMATMPSGFESFQLVETRRGEVRFASKLIEIRGGVSRQYA